MGHPKVADFGLPKMLLGVMMLIILIMCIYMYI